MRQEKTGSERLSFSKKIWIASGIFAFVVIFIWFLKVTIAVLLLIMAGALVSIFFHRLAGLIQKYMKFSPTISLISSILTTFLFVVLLFWFIGAKIQEQFQELSATLPATIEHAKEQIRNTQIGARIISENESMMSTQNIFSFARQFFATGFGVLGDLFVILLISVFFTISPRLYVNGLIALIPPDGKSQARSLMDKIGNTLGNWLKGQIIAMFIIIILTFIGLTIIGIPMALALALIAGFLNFVPNFGPLIAMIPAVLVGLLQSPATAMIVAGLYLLIQALESNLITPYIQNKLIQLPPALILIGQLLMGTLMGAMGIILATPIVALIMVVVQELYVKKQ